MSQTRRLAAILAADVAGYSRLMGADEEGTLAALKALRRELARRAPSHLPADDDPTSTEVGRALRKVPGGAWRQIRGSSRGAHGI